MSRASARWTGCLVAACAALALPGCAGRLQTQGAPRLGVAQVVLRHLDPARARFELWFEVENPGPRELRLEEIRFRLELEGNDVGPGEHRAPLVVAGFGRLRTAATVEMALLERGTELARILAGKELRIVMSGSYRLRDERQDRVVPLHARARLALSREP